MLLQSKLLPPLDQRHSPHPPHSSHVRPTSLIFIAHSSLDSSFVHSFSIEIQADRHLIKLAFSPLQPPLQPPPPRALEPGSSNSTGDLHDQQDQQKSTRVPEIAATLTAYLLPPILLSCCTQLVFWLNYCRR